jgi:hypothetical protein
LLVLTKALLLYLAHLIALIGTPYAKLNCSRYILAARGADLELCNSSEMYYGCGGRMVQVGAAHKDVVELSLYEDELQPGDVICFRAGHVSAYLGAGLMVGSGRSGVKVRRILGQFPLDNWYHGPIRVQRWKDLAEKDLRPHHADPGMLARLGNNVGPKPRAGHAG